MSVDTSVDGVDGVECVSSVCRECVESVEPGLKPRRTYASFRLTVRYPHAVRKPARTLVRAVATAGHLPVRGHLLARALPSVSQSVVA